MKHAFIKEKVVAVVYGALCHLIFIMAGMTMFWTLLNGFSNSKGTLHFPISLFANLVLLVQFPILHSFLLSNSGKKWLHFLAPSQHGKVLATTVYVTIASCQLLALFVLWSPTNIYIYKLNYPYNIPHICLFLASWGLLTLSSFQAGYKVQTGLLGWTALFRGKKPIYPNMPTHGLFLIIRQPIYLSFCLVLWTSPYMTLDLLLIAISYSIYCYLAPLLKERRFTIIYGEAFIKYKKAVPYFFPRIFKNKKIYHKDL